MHDSQGHCGTTPKVIVTRSTYHCARDAGRQPKGEVTYTEAAVTHTDRVRTLVE